MPKTLYEVGASQAVFLRKHDPDGSLATAVAGFYRAQRAALIRHMVAGTCEPGDVGRVMGTLAAGLAEGAHRDIAALTPIETAAEPFNAFRPTGEAPRHAILSGHRIHATVLRAEARDMVNKGHTVSLYLFSRTALFHRVRFHDGYWEQTGGLWGKSVRTDPVFQPCSFAQRLGKETARVVIRRDPLNAADRDRQLTKFNV